jgi:hypothetical protein
MTRPARWTTRPPEVNEGLTAGASREMISEGDRKEGKWLG